MSAGKGRRRRSSKPKRRRSGQQAKVPDAGQQAKVPDAGQQAKVPDIAGSRAAKILGDGEGMQKLCYVLFLSRYSDELALQLADLGGVMGAAKALSKDGKGPEERSEGELVILNKACRIFSVLEEDAIDLWMVRRMKGERALASGDLRAQALGYLEYLRWASEYVSTFLARHQEGPDLADVGIDRECLSEIRKGAEEMCRLLAVLRSADDVALSSLEVLTRQEEGRGEEA